MADISIDLANYCGTALVSCWPETQAQMTGQLREVLGMEVPEKLGQFTEDGARIIAYIAPGRYLILSESEPISAAITQQSDAALCTVTELDSSRDVFRLRGDKAAQLLMKGAAIDLDLAKFPAGSLFQSAIHEMGVTALRRGPQWFDLLVYKSFSASFAHWLEDAAMEFSESTD